MRLVSETGSTSISLSCAGSLTIQARCSSCSMRRGSFEQSVEADATTISSRPLEESILPDGMTVAGRLRSKSRSVEYALKSQTLARQLKTASSAGVKNVVLLRRDDYANGKVTVKTLADGSERSVALEAFLNSL